MQTNIEIYLSRSFSKDWFDCADLAALFMRNEFGIDTSEWRNITRNHGDQKMADYGRSVLISQGFEDVEDAYQKGDIIVYRIGKSSAGVATCADNTTALLMERYSKLKQVDRIENKVYHLRHKSLIKKEEVA